MEMQNLKDNNPVFKTVTNSVSPLVDKSTDLLKKNEFVQSA